MALKKKKKEGKKESGRGGVKGQTVKLQVNCLHSTQC